MNSATYSSHVSSLTSVPRTQGIEIRPLRLNDLDELTRLYFRSYPPGVAAESFDDAYDEMEMSFAGAFGKKAPGGFLGAEHDGRLIGVIMTVLDPPWNDVPDGPFVIELFVHPDHRGQGVASSLLAAVAQKQEADGQESIALRVDLVDAADAARLYRTLGFTEHEEFN